MIQKLLLIIRLLFLKFSDSFSEKSFIPGVKLLCLGMFFVVSISHATDYYSKSTGNLNVVGTWGTAIDGSGTSPTNFTTDGNVFYIRNNATPTIGSNWLVSGTGSKIVLGNGTVACNFTVSGALTVTGSMDISTNATLTISSSALQPIVFGSLSSTSTVNYSRGGNQTILTATYGNLILSSSGTKTLAGAITTNGALTLSGTASLAMSTYLLTLNSNLTNGGTGTISGTTGGVTISGGNSQSISGFTTTGVVTIVKTGGVATLNGIISSESFIVNSGPYLNLGSSNHITNSLYFGTTTQDPGTWGSTNSTANNKNNTYFGLSSGILNVGKTYCVPDFNNTVRPITNVVFNTITNSSSALTNSPKNESYINYKTSVISGTSYTISVQGNTDGNNTQYYSVYFDWNQNGNFTDSGESFYIGNISNSTGIDNKTTFVSILVPASAQVGTTRMRVISRSANNIDPCPSTSNRGQSEDYSINVEVSCSTAPAPGQTLTTANPVCSNTPFTLSVQNPTTGGASYQWQTSIDGSNWSTATPGPVTIINTDFSSAPTNGIIKGNNTSIAGGELILTPSAASYTGGYLINTTPGSNITPFTASFDFRMNDGTAADGMSLSYGPDYTLFNSGSGGGEEGEGTGFILKFDTYDNSASTTGSMIRIMYAGTQIFANSVNPFNLRDPAYRTAVLAVDANGLLSLKIGSTIIVSGLSVPSYVAADKTNWYFKFSARSGGQYDKHSIDKMLIQCGDVGSTNSTYTTTQTAPLYYRAQVNCGGSVVSSQSVLVNMISAVVNPITTSTCNNVAFSVTPTNGTNGSVPSGTTYSWPIPVVTGGMSGAVASTGAPTIITGTLNNTTAVDQTATYTVTPTTSGCVGASFTITVTINPTLAAPTVGTIMGIGCSNLGSVVLSGLPSGNWTINQTGTGAPASYINTTANTTSYTVTGLALGTYNFTVSNGTCTSTQTSPVSISDQTSATWNGTSWTGGPPSASKNVIITSVSPNQPFTSDITICSLTINNTSGDVIIPTGVTLTVNNSITSNNKLVFQNNSSLMQSETAVNTGNIEYRRIAPQIRQADYVYWSTPVNPQTLIAVSPLTDFDNYYYNNAPGWVAIDRNLTMTIGKGYIIRGPETFSNSAKADYQASFIGVPNNGTYTTESLTVARYHLLGNPYPSALSIDALVDGNTVLNGTVYLWTHNTGVNTTAAYKYNPDDYASYNRVGGIRTAALTGNATNDSERPKGFIAAGQAFFASTKATGPVTFNNSMRRAGTNNSQFFKSAETSKETAIEKNRIWLNMTNTDGLFKQLLVGYVEGASNGYENKFDGISMDANQYLDFYSMINANKFVIQGRALPFADTDVVALGYRTTVAGDFTIAIDEVDGNLTSQKIYIEDKTTGAIHDLTQSNYTFKTEAGSFTNRLVLRYTGKTLGTGDFDNIEDGILVSIKNKEINILSSKENIKEVTVYDISGKILYNKKKIGSTELQIQNLPSSNQVLLVKVTLANDFTTTRKIIFQ